MLVDLPSSMTTFGAGVLTQLIALGVLTFPLFALPIIMKMTGGILERFGVWANNRNRGIVDRSRKKGQEMYNRGDFARGRELRKRAADEQRSTDFANRLGKGGRTGVMARGVAGNVGRIKGLEDTAIGAQNSRLASYAIAAEREAAGKRRKAIRDELSNSGATTDDTYNRYIAATKAGNIDEAAATLSHLSTTYGGGGRTLAAKALQETDLTAVGDTAKQKKMATELNNTIGGELYTSLIGSRADIAKGMFQANGKFEFKDISTLTAPQMASQDADVHTRGAARGESYNADEARIAMTNPELIAKVMDSGTRQELSRVSGVPVSSEPGQNVNISQTYGDNLNSFDAPTLSRLIGGAAGGVGRLSNTDLRRISERVRNEQGIEFRALREELNTEQQRRDNINPPPTPPPTGGAGT